MREIRTCVVGVGFVGSVHIETLRRLGNVNIIAIADEINANEKALKFSVPKGYADYRQMIDTEKPDVIHICTPNNTHFEIAMYAMERGIHVVCEKPLATTAEQAKIMQSLAKEKGVVNAINLNFRFNPQVMQMKMMIQNDNVGKIHTVHGEYLQDWLFYDTDYNWRLESNISGNSRAFADIGSHWIDMVEWVVEQHVVQVFADFETIHKTRKKPLKPMDTFSNMSLKPEDYHDIPIHTEDYAAVLFRFDGGAKGSCVVNQVFAGRKNQTSVSISGSKCSLYWNSDLANELWVGRRDGYNFNIVKDPSILFPEAKAIISYPGGHLEGFADTFKQSFRRIYTLISEGTNTKQDFADFSDGFHLSVLCEKIIQSAHEGRWVTVEN